MRHHFPLAMISLTALGAVSGCTSRVASCSHALSSAFIALGVGVAGGRAVVGGGVGNGSAGGLGTFAAGLALVNEPKTGVKAMMVMVQNV